MCSLCNKSIKKYTTGSGSHSWELFSPTRLLGCIQGTSKDGNRGEISWAVPGSTTNANLAKARRTRKLGPRQSLQEAAESQSRMRCITFIIFLIVVYFIKGNDEKHTNLLFEMHLQLPNTANRTNCWVFSKSPPSHYILAMAVVHTIFDVRKGMRK